MNLIPKPNSIILYLIFTGIGQPLSMLLKLNPAVTKLNLYDIVHTPGVAADLSHCETKSTSTGFVGKSMIILCYWNLKGHTLRASICILFYQMYT